MVLLLLGIEEGWIDSFDQENRDSQQDLLGDFRVGQEEFFSYQCANEMDGFRWTRAQLNDDDW